MAIKMAKTRRKNGDKMSKKNDNKMAKKRPNKTEKNTKKRRSTTVPDFSHFLGCLPRWFCRYILSPSNRGASGRVCMSRASVERGILARIASSL